jgi:hypothetical protein
MRDSTIATERTYRGHLDLACELLADENAEQAARIADLENDVDWLRELLSAAVDRLHQAHVDRLEQQRRYYRLLDEVRAIRAAQRSLFTVKSDPARTSLEDSSSERKTTGPESSWTH